MQVKKYFTIVSNRNGFGDFFRNWLPLYNLMTNLGFNYIHTPIQLQKRHTTENSRDIEEFIGFDIFENHQKYQNLKKYDINFKYFYEILGQKNFKKN